ncbi:RNA-binding protein [uncultured Bacteroides sp.]|nr:RNA-binding protein [uncultured Bacteroides sp.]
MGAAGNKKPKKGADKPKVKSEYQLEKATEGSGKHKKEKQ